MDESSYNPPALEKTCTCDVLCEMPHSGAHVCNVEKGGSGVETAWTFLRSDVSSCSTWTSVFFNYALQAGNGHSLLPLPHRHLLGGLHLRDIEKLLVMEILDPGKRHEV